MAINIGAPKPVGLTPQQINELNLAATRMQGKDQANLDYARKRYGFVPTTITPSAGGMNNTTQTPVITTPSTPTEDPITKFNTTILDMLKQAQAGTSNAPLLAETNRLQNANITTAMDPNLGKDLSPSGMLSTIGNASNRYDAPITNIADRMRLNNESLQRFESILDKAKEYGGELVKLSPSKDVIDGYKRYLVAGGDIKSIDKDVAAKVIAGMSNDEWTQANNAGVTTNLPTSVQEYEYAKNQGYTGKYLDWIKSKEAAQRAPSSGGGTQLIGTTRNTALSQLQDAVNKLNIGETTWDSVNPQLKGFIGVTQEVDTNIFSNTNGQTITKYKLNEPTDKQLIELANSLGKSSPTTTTTPSVPPRLGVTEIQNLIRTAKESGDSKEQMVEDFIGLGFAREIAERLVNINY